MKIHREGYVIILVAFLILSAIQIGNYLLFTYTEWLWLYALFSLGAVVMMYLIVQFFRVPKRECVFSENDIMCPADGKVVVIEEVEETEYFKDKRIQISIFMSPINVHVTRYAISGIIKFSKYHPGIFLVAWHPKSSTDNERSTFVTQHKNGQEVLFRQIAGAVARRICYYAKPDQNVTAGEEFGFIKFGSRIDLMLPIGTKIDIQIGDKVQAKLTKIGELKSSMT